MAGHSFLPARVLQNLSHGLTIHMPPGASSPRKRRRIETLPLEPDPAHTGEGSAAPCALRASACTPSARFLERLAMATRTRHSRPTRTPDSVVQPPAESYARGVPPRSTKVFVEGRAASACRCAKLHCRAASRRCACTTRPGLRATTCGKGLPPLRTPGSGRARRRYRPAHRRRPRLVPDGLRRPVLRGTGTSPSCSLPAAERSRGDGVRRPPRGDAGRAGAERGGARARDHPANITIPSSSRCSSAAPST